MRIKTITQTPKKTFKKINISNKHFYYHKRVLWESIFL